MLVGQARCELYLLHDCCKLPALVVGVQSYLLSVCVPLQAAVQLDLGQSVPDHQFCFYKVELESLFCPHRGTGFMPVERRHVFFFD